MCSLAKRNLRYMQNLTQEEDTQPEQNSFGQGQLCAACYTY